MDQLRKTKLSNKFGYFQVALPGGYYDQVSYSRGKQKWLLDEINESIIHRVMTRGLSQISAWGLALANAPCADVRAVRAAPKCRLKQACNPSAFPRNSARKKKCLALK